MLDLRQTISKFSLSLWLTLLLVGCGTDPMAGVALSSDEPAPSEVPPADDTGQANIQAISKATWGVAVRVEADTGPVFIVFGTAFAVDSSRLVTNAHIIDGVLEIAPTLTSEEKLVAVQHETGTFVEVDRMWKHPDYDPDRFLSTPDVGVIAVQGTLPTFVTLAGDSIVRELSVLDEVSLCGFPGDVSALGSTRPRVTCLSGNLTALRPFNQSDPASPGNTFLIQHDIQTSPGTSGSAIFDAAGRVVAVHNAATTELGASNRFGIRIDLVRALLEDIDTGQVASLTIDRTPLDTDGDGFSDSEEINGTPGTDPFDPTDNPNNVHDTDGDGCSDFDELNFDGFCDNDPNTPKPIVECPPAAFRFDPLNFGFDPPPGFDGPFADDRSSSFELFAVDFVFDGRLRIFIGVSSFGFSLADWISGWIDTQTRNGLSLVRSEQLTMPSATEATILTWFDPGTTVDFYVIELWAVRSGLLYRFRAFMSPGDFVTFEPTILDSFRSVCID